MIAFAPGTVMLVTGATGGIGFEIALQAARAGVVVGVHGSRPESVSAASDRLRAEVPEAVLLELPADFHQAGAIESLLQRTVAGGGRLDAVVHCAIIGAPDTSGVFNRTDPDNYAALAGGVLATFERLCRFAMPHLARQGGTIVAFASDSGRFAAPRQSLIGAVFGGIMAFVRNLALEAARDKVRVHCISPSYVLETPIYERFATAMAGRGVSASERAGLGLPTPRDIAPMVLFLCGPGAEKITGQVISINGGLNA